MWGVKTDFRMRLLPANSKINRLIADRRLSLAASLGSSETVPFVFTSASCERGGESAGV
jgi:hypothetical protein